MPNSPFSVQRQLGLRKTLDVAPDLGWSSVFSAAVTTLF